MPSATANDAPYGIITENVVEELEKGRPWMRFVGFLCYLGAALQLAAAALLGAGITELPAVGIIALIYLLLAGLYVSFGMRLSNGAAAIKRIRTGGGAEALAEAARHQSALWRSVGMLALLMILLWAVAAILIGIFI